MAITKVSSELIKDNSITMDKMHTGVVITTSEGLHNNANDTVLPTAGAVAAYVTSQVTGANNWDLSFAWGDHSTYGYATETYVNNSIANVINSAPAALDTLNELAAALGDDPNFATTVTNLIAGKQDAGTYNTIIGTDSDIDTSGATIVDNIYVTDGVITSMGTRTLTLGDLGYTGATNANYITNNNQLTNGAGYLTTSGKAADSNLLDGLESSFAPTGNTVPVRNANGDISAREIVLSSGLSALTPTVLVSMYPTTNQLVRTTPAAVAASMGAWTSGNDGSGSGLDADLLDGLQAASFTLRSDDYFKPFAELGSAVNLNDFRTSGYASQNSNSDAGAGSNYPTAHAGIFEVVNDDTGNGVHTTQRYARYNTNDFYARNYYNGTWTSWTRFLTTSDEGSGNGLDADTLDGLQGSQFLRSDADDTFTGGLTVTGLLTVGTSGSSNIYMGDSNEGTRIIHNNSNRIGFLTQAASWGSYCSDNGDWTTDFISYAGASMRAPLFYDTNNTGYYLDPASTSNLNAVSAASVTTPVVTATEIYANNWFRNNGSNEGLYNQVTTQHWSSNTNGYWDASSTTSTSGIRFYTAGHVNTLKGYVYSSGAGFGLLDNDGDWALRTQTGTLPLELRCDNNVEFEVYSSYTSSPGSSRAPIFYDTNNTGYYLDPTGQSRLGNIERNTHSTGFLVGSYNTAGANDAKTNPIYTIGNAYKPTDTSLAGMYGIGYAHENLWGAGKTPGWGLYVASNGTVDCTIGAGATTLWARNDIVAYSDRRVKDNIEIIPDALEKVKQLNGVTFTRTDANEEDKDRRHTGVIAQDVLKVLPEAVVGSEDDLYSVAYGNMVGLLIEAIKEQQTQIDELKKLINKQ